MSGRERLIQPAPGSLEYTLSSMRGEYRTLVATATVVILALLFGLVFGLRQPDNTQLVANLTDRVTHLENATAQLVANVSALSTSNTHLYTEVMSLMVSSLTFSVRHLQNGTCTFGFPPRQGTAVEQLSDYSDYVVLNYTLREILLTPASVPLTILELSATPRPIVFSGYTPPVTLPSENDLAAQLAFFDPPIAILDSLGQIDDNLPYSYVMASRIALNPNCVAMTSLQQDSSHCTEENAYTPRFSSSYPTPNTVRMFTNNNAGPGRAIMQFLWGQWDYTSLVSQYDFTGTTISFTAPLEMLLRNI